MGSNSATSTLDIVLKDDVSSAAKAVAASLEKVQAEAKSVDEALSKSGTRDVLQSRLKQLGASKAQIEGVAKAFGDMTKAEGLALDKSKEWTKAQREQVAAWENVTVAKIRADRGLERAREYAAIAEAKKAEQLDEKAHQRRMQMAAQEAAARHRLEERAAEQRAHGEAHHGFRNYMLQSAALAVSAHGIMSVIENAVEHGAEYQHRLVALRNSGRSEGEISEMQAASHAALRGAPTATLTGNLEILNETVGAFGSVEHAIEHLGFMNKAAAVLHAVAGDKISESPGAMGNQLARFFEMRGTAGNSEVFEREASEMMKSMVFTGGNVNPRELVNFATQAKSALQNYSIGFLSRIAPSMIGELGGDKAGTQAAAFANVILGKARDAKQTEAWLKYGLLDPTKTIKGNKGPTGWTGGAVYNTDEALRDPLAFGEKYVLPALEKAGVKTDNQLELTKVLGTLFRNGMSNAFANELWQAQNRKRLHKDAGYVGEVEDPDAIYHRLLKTDPTVAYHALKGSIENLLTTVTSPMMGTAATMLSGLAGTLNDVAIAAHDNPVTAVASGLAVTAGALTAAGALSYKLLNGFGNATFGPAAGEMVAAGHEQLLAGRTMLAAAEAFRAGAVANDVPGVVPGGKAGGKAVGAAERAVVREGETVAEGAAEVAIGNKVVGAIEGALKGGLKAEGLAVTATAGLEIAAAAGVTLTAGTVAIVGFTAAAFLAGIRASMDPKHQAAKDPGFGNPFAPNAPIDFDDPKYRDPDGMSEEEKKDAAKHWWDRGRGTPRGSVQSQKDTDLPGHWVTGPHGRMIWALENHDPMKNAPYFSTAPLDGDGHVKGMLPYGWVGDRVPADPSTGTIFGLNRMPVDPRRSQAFDDAPPRPPVTAGPTLPLPPDSARYPVVPEPVGTNAPPLAPPPPVAPAPAAPAAPPVDHALDGFVMGQLTPKVDTSAITAAADTATQAGTTMQTALNVTASPQVDASSIHAASAAVDQLAGKLAAIGAQASAAAAAVAAIGGAGGAARPGPSLASRARGRFGDGASQYG